MDKIKELIVKTRDKVNEMLLGFNCIDKLMTDKVNDYILIEEQPLAILIGNKTIFVGNFTIENNYKFWEGYGKLLAMIGMKHINFELLNDGQELYKTILMNKMFYKEMCKLINNHILKQQAYYLNDKKERKKIKWRNCTFGYFKKHITIPKLMQICGLIYSYNFNAEKKMLTGFIQRNEGKGSFEELYSFLASKFAWSDGKFLTCPINKCRLLVQRQNERNSRLNKK